jgi:hypothetical protein
MVRVARRNRDGSWHLVEPDGPLQRIVPLSWHRDAEGHRPWVEFEMRELGNSVQCPACDDTWAVEEMDCVFGDARRSGNDLLLLMRGGGCQLPLRVRLVGFLTAYPGVVERMVGWADWARREQRTREEEVQRYGVSCDEPLSPAG